MMLQLLFSFQERKLLQERDGLSLSLLEKIAVMEKSRPSLNKILMSKLLFKLSLIKLDKILGH
jgi:hypothetical protein